MCMNVGINAEQEFASSARVRLGLEKRKTYDYEVYLGFVYTEHNLGFSKSESRISDVCNADGGEANFDRETERISR